MKKVKVLSPKKEELQVAGQPGFDSVLVRQFIPANDRNKIDFRLMR
ncbi:MAG: hypothetical protein WDN75_13340 [Bacteroidota bacterium]